MPAQRKIDRRLVGGALLFGIGWGMSGICPGPALVDLGFINGCVAVFVLAMLAGMALYAFGLRLQPSAPAAAAVRQDA